MMRPKLLIALLLAGSGPLHAAAPAPAPLRIASWNLGWHIALAEHAAWAAQCDKSYARDDSDGVWKPVPAGSPGALSGWQVAEPRARLQGVDLALMPPCGIYQTEQRERLAASAEGLRDRNRRIAALLAEVVRADVIAFQEVSGTAAVREALGAQSDDFHVCSFDGQYKVQRLAFAWRKRLGEALEPCRVEAGLALMQLPPAEQVRPGLVLSLRHQGQVLRLLNVHLKSGCVAPAGERGRLDQNTGPADPCPVLQQQLAPLEASVEALGKDGAGFIVLGDFNRNLGLERAGIEGARALRSDGSDLSSPLQPGQKSQSLLAEINDQQPPASAARLVTPSCRLDAALNALCERASREPIARRDLAPLGAAGALGCRNGVGLDHFLVAESLSPHIGTAYKVALGSQGQSRAAAGGAVQQLAVSDHCPIVLELAL